MHYQLKIKTKRNIIQLKIEIKLLVVVQRGTEYSISQIEIIDELHFE